MNPIRIAPGPPTEAGNYLYRQSSDEGWTPTEVGFLDGEPVMLWGMDQNTVNYFTQRYGLEWSTRIPDPEEME